MGKFMPHLDVVGIGRAPLDMIYVVDHFPAGDDLIRVEEASIQGGGPVPNALCALARLGASTALIDTVGDDWQGKKIIEFLEEQNVMTNFMMVEPSSRSTVSTILVERSTGKRAIINYKGNTPPPVLSQTVIDLMSHSQILHLSGSYPNVNLEAVPIFKELGGKVSFDGGAGLFKDIDRKLIPNVDYCICAIGYAQAYTGNDSIPQMLDVLLDEGVEVAGITCGVDGSWFKSRRGDIFHQPAFHLSSIVDTTGCGDVFHGVFLYGILQGFPLPKTAKYASAAAAIVSTRLGGSISSPTLEEILTLTGE